MKKIFSFLVIATLLVAAIGCAKTTTVAPTTAAPTTAAPTTVAPTTVAPTTAAPTTVAPTTVAPTTAAPTTVAPTTVAPTTAAPTTTEAVGVITWSGLEDETVVRGDTVDLLAGITASDSIDGDITVDIEIADDDGFTSALAGGYEVTYTVTNSTNVVSTETKYFSVLVAHNVANGDFALGAYNWNLDIPGGSATVSYTEEQATVSITNPGNSWWGIQLYQSNVVFKQGNTYKLSFDAASEDLRSVAGGFEDINGGYAMLLGGFQSTPLTETMSQYEVYFTTMQDYDNVKVVVYLGYQLPSDEVTGDPHVVVIDNINVSIVEASEEVTFSGVDEEEIFSGDVFNPLAGVTATNSASEDVTSSIEVLGVIPTEIKVGSAYILTYLVRNTDETVSFVTRKIGIALAKDFEYQVVNGSFDNGLTGWVQDVNQTDGTGVATFTDNGDGSVSILVTEASTADWHIQLQQAACTFKAGETYVVRFVAKASAERVVSIEVVDPSNGWAWIADKLVNAQLGTDYTTYEIHFTADKDYTFAKVGLLLGDSNVSNPDGITVTVDELQVYKYDAFNEEFTTTNEPWVYDHIDAEVVDGAVVATFVETGAAEGWVLGSDPWNNQLYQSSGSELVAGHTYRVEVLVKSSIGRTIRAWIEDVNKGYAAIAADWTEHTVQAVLVADVYSTITYDVVITDANATTNAKFVVMFGDSAAAGVAHTVTVDYFRITDITDVPAE